MDQSEYLKRAIEDKYIEIDNVKNRISYKTREGIKSYPLLNRCVCGFAIASPKSLPSVGAAHTPQPLSAIALDMEAT